MKEEQVPENAIDRFFYKIGRGAKNTGTTIKESEVIGKTLGFIFRDPWGIFVVIFLIALVAGGLLSLLGID